MENLQKNIYKSTYITVNLKQPYKHIHVYKLDGLYDKLLSVYLCQKGSFLEQVIFYHYLVSGP